ncbi:MAG: hypothetical protein IMY77_02815 [Chloroflexi bacterium]|nr:hypothetical protein [Chloroflexota bacterium]
METYYLWQIILVGVLVAVTIYYAVQTYRQANLLKEQIEENRKRYEEERRIRAAERVLSWAEESFDVLARPTRYKDLSQQKVDLIIRLQPSHVKSYSILHFVEKLGGELNTKTKTAYICFSKFIATLGTEEDITRLKEYFWATDFGEAKPINNGEELKEAKKELMLYLGEVINSAADFLLITPL